jgi:hypothetical protein
MWHARGEERKLYNFFLAESLKERDHLEDRGVDGGISQWIFGKLADGA